MPRVPLRPSPEVPWNRQVSVKQLVKSGDRLERAGMSWGRQGSHESVNQDWPEEGKGGVFPGEFPPPGCKEVPAESSVVKRRGCLLASRSWVKKFLPKK